MAGRPTGTSRCLPPLPRSSTERPRCRYRRRPGPPPRRSAPRWNTTTPEAHGSAASAVRRWVRRRRRPRAAPTHRRGSGSWADDGSVSGFDGARDVEVDDPSAAAKRCSPRTAINARAADTADRAVAPVSGSPRRSDTRKSLTSTSVTSRRSPTPRSARCSTYRLRSRR